MNTFVKSLFTVSFKAEGLSLEKLVKQCGELDMPLTRLKRVGAKEVTGRISKDDFEKLKTIADQRGWQITLSGRHGLEAFAHRFRKRWGLAVGLTLAVVLISVALQFIWQVELIDAGSYAGDLRGYLKEQGIGTGTYKRSLDINGLQSELEWRYPKVAWVRISYWGSTLKIQLVEGVPVPQVETEGEAGDIVAARAGIVVSVEPAAGTAMVKAGDIVTQGQLLIKGVERNGTGDEYLAVKARGKVLARVWDKAAVRVPMYETVSEPTGSQTVAQAVVTPYFTWGQLNVSDYFHYDTLVETWPVVGAWLPVWLRRETYIEVTLSYVLRNEDEVKAEAGLAALRALRQKIGTDDELVDKWVDYCMIEGKDMEASATAERVIDIAQSLPGGLGAS